MTCEILKNIRCGFDCYTFENLLNRKKVYTYNNNKGIIICYIFKKKILDFGEKKRT